MGRDQAAGRTVMGDPVGNACPGCGQPAQLMIGNEQMFCGNDDCHVFLWNPTMSLGELSEDAGFTSIPDLRRIFGVDDAE